MQLCLVKLTKHNTFFWSLKEMFSYHKQLSCSTCMQQMYLLFQNNIKIVKYKSQVLTIEKWYK